MPPRKVTGGAAKIAIVAITVVSAALSTSASADYVYDPNDFAVEVVSSTGPFGAAPYDAPASLLGRPTLSFNSSFNPSAPDLRKSKLIEGIFNTGGDGSKLITTLNEGSQVTVRMGRPVTNDPNNPFGIDFIVFGNAFYAGAGDDVGEDTDLTEYTLSGAIFGEQVKVSVSPNGTNWYRYETGPFGDGAFPTNGYLWDRLSKAWTNVEADPTKPVDPALSVAGKSAADVLDLYAGSAGGTGFDLAPSGFSSIQYIRVEGLSGFSGGEIDAFADVKPVPEPGVVGALAAFAMIALSRRARLA